MAVKINNPNNGFLSTIVFYLLYAYYTALYALISSNRSHVKHFYATVNDIVNKFTTFSTANDYLRNQMWSNLALACTWKSDMNWWQLTTGGNWIWSGLLGVRDIDTVPKDMWGARNIRRIEGVYFLAFVSHSRIPRNCVIKGVYFLMTLRMKCFFL